VKTWWIRVKMRVLGSIARFALNRPQALQWGVRVLGPLALRRLRRKLSPPEQVRQMDGAIATLEREVARDRLWEDQLALGQLLVGRRRYAEATELFRGVAENPLAEAQAKAEARLWFARSLEYAGRLPEARIAYTRYLAESPAVGSLERRRIERRIADL
jgi:tetratricopeptide (TPR) repeat protein